jgi:hypothetical protein
MTQEDSKEAFKKLLDLKGYTYRDLHNENGEILIVSTDRHVELPDINYLPSHVCFQNNGYVDLSSIEILPEYTVFENSGNIYLESLKEFSKGVRFKNGKDSFGFLRLKIALEVDGISWKEVLNCYIKQIYG